MKAENNTHVMKQKNDGCCMKSAYDEWRGKICYRTAKGSEREVLRKCGKNIYILTQ